MRQRAKVKPGAYLGDIGHPIHVVAPAEAEPLGADPVLVRARHPSLDLLVSPCLEDRREGVGGEVVAYVGVTLGAIALGLLVVVL